MNFKIIGLGEIGKAILKLVKNRQGSSIWVEDVSGGEFIRGEFEDAKTDIAFFCVPTGELEGVALNFKNKTNENAIAVILSKGLNKDGEAPAEFVSKILGDHRIAILAGPMLSSEILNSQKAFATCATSSEAIYDVIFDIFDNTELFLEKTEDMFGVSAYSVLKNIYTIGFGILSGVGFGDNVRGAYLNFAFNEMKYIAENIYGASPKTANASCALGDFLATSMHESSHNFRAGMEIVNPPESGSPTWSEGMNSIAPLVDRIGELSVNTPILMRIADIVSGNKVPESIGDAVAYKEF